MKKRLCLVLAMVCLLCAGCGQKKTATPTKTTNNEVGSVKANPDLKVEDCYTYTENKDGTFSYQVEWRGGGVLCFQKDMIRPAFFDAVSEDVPSTSTIIAAWPDPVARRTTASPFCS